MLSGFPLTRLEAICLFGIQNLTTVIAGLRAEGWNITSKKVPYARAVVRLNEHATFEPPKNLPIREIIVTEYSLQR